MDEQRRESSEWELMKEEEEDEDGKERVDC